MCHIVDFLISLLMPRLIHTLLCCFYKFVIQHRVCFCCLVRQKEHITYHNSWFTTVCNLVCAGDSSMCEEESESIIACDG